MDDLTLAAVMIGGTIMLAVVGVALLARKPEAKQMEDRLAGMTGGRARAKAEKAAESLLKAPPIGPGQLRLMEQILPRPDALKKLYEQADMDLDFTKFLWLAGGLALLGGVASYFLLPPLLIPIGMAAMGAMPFMFLVQRKNKRLRKCLDALPEAVELMARALRAGHGFASGLQLVASETKGPLSEEFGRVFEEQNLGVPLEVALRGMAERVPAMDVNFLVTAVVIQRATGGDLAEVLDKIGKLVRQRFELFGHVRSLTAEGRLSGIVLLAMPIALLGFLVVTNFGYVAPLFRTTMGQKMLGATAFLQVLGALSIRKIVAIKV